MAVKERKCVRSKTIQSIAASAAWFLVEGVVESKDVSFEAVANDWNMAIVRWVSKWIKRFIIDDWYKSRWLISRAIGCHSWEWRFVACRMCWTYPKRRRCRRPVWLLERVTSNETISSITVGVKHRFSKCGTRKAQRFSRIIASRFDKAKRLIRRMRRTTNGDASSSFVWGISHQTWRIFRIDGIKSRVDAVVETVE